MLKKHNRFGRYIGIPFKENGRDEYGCDCWGLVRLIYAYELNIILPKYNEISTNELIAVAREINSAKDAEIWKSVERENVKQFDVVVMCQAGKTLACHVGVMMDDRQLIHVEKSHDAVIVPMDHYTVKERIACFRRYKTR